MKVHSVAGMDRISDAFVSQHVFTANQRVYGVVAVVYTCYPPARGPWFCTSLVSVN